MVILVNVPWMISLNIWLNVALLFIEVIVWSKVWLFTSHPVNIWMISKRIILSLDHWAISFSSENTGTWLVVSISGRSFGLNIPLLFMAMVEFGFVPRMISLDVWLDVALLLMKMVILLLLSKRTMCFITEGACSWLVVGVTSWSLGLSVPLLLVALVELSLVPWVISLVIWFDIALLFVKVVVFSFLGKRCMFFPSENAASWIVVCISGGGFSLLVPVLFVWVVELCLIPRMVSLIVGLDIALLLVEMVVLTFLGKCWIHVSSPSLDWLGVILVIFKHLLVTVGVRSDALSCLKASFFGEFFFVRIAAVFGSPCIGSINVIGPLWLSIGFISVDELWEALLVGLWESLVLITSPSLDWLRMVFMVLKILLITTRVWSNALSCLKGSLLMEFTRVRVGVLIWWPSVLTMIIWY